MRRGSDQVVPLAGKRRRLKSLNEFDAPYWKGIFDPRRKEGVAAWIIPAGFAAGVAIGLVVL
jgi:hypothetical protein